MFNNMLACIHTRTHVFSTLVCGINTSFVCQPPTTGTLCVGLEGKGHNGSKKYLCAAEPTVTDAGQELF